MDPIPGIDSAQVFTPDDLMDDATQLPGPGSRVVVSFGAANRDAAVFESPDDYRLERDCSQHLGFGQGRHYCLGSRLARLEAVASLEALLDRFEELALGDTPGCRLHSTVIRGFESLSLRLSSAG